MMTGSSPQYVRALFTEPMAAEFGAGAAALQVTITVLIVLQTLTDTFGTKNATTNYGCLYIAQGVGWVLGGPMASLLHDGTGS